MNSIQPLMLGAVLLHFLLGAIAKRQQTTSTRKPMK
jgi:hypothetical protein